MMERTDTLVREDGLRALTAALGYVGCGALCHTPAARFL